MPDLLQSVLTQAGLALAPLRAIKAPDQAVAFFRQMGYEIPPAAFGPDLQALSTEADQLLIAVGQLTEASGEGGVAAAIANLFTHVVAMVDAISQLHVQIQAGGGGVLPNIGDLPRRVTDFLVLDLFERQKPEVHETLHLLGLIEHEPNPAPGQSSRLINWNRFGQILNEPSRIANDVYQWDTDFDVEKFLTRMEQTMRAASLPGGIYPQSATAQAALGNATSGLRELRFPIFQKGLTPETYSQFGITFSPVEAQGAKKKGIALLPYLIGAAAFDFEVCDRGELVFESTSDIRGIGIVIHPPFNAEGLLNLTGAFHASVKIREKPSRAEEISLIGSGGGTRLSIQGLGIKWFAEGPPEQLDLGFEAEAQALRLVIAPGEGDGFLQTILSGLNVQAEAGFAFGMTLLSGFTFKGGTKLALELGTHVDLGPVKVDGLRLSLAPANDRVVLEAGAILRCDLGPLAAVVENVGLRSEVRFRPGNLGPADLGITFKPPNGLGLAIDAPVVLGGGFLRFDPQKEEYSGMLELQIAETIAVKATGLLITRMPDGAKGYSLLIIITAEDFKPIPLPLGFRLIGIGGLLAINRTFDEDALRAGLKNHTLDSVLFPRDPIRNAPQILSNLNSVFPPANDHHLFGPMAQIAWGTPTLITADLAVVLEFGARQRLLILAQVAAILPKPENDLIRLQMDAIGWIDFDQGTAALDATLHDSRLLKKFVLTGDMAMRLKWEGSRNFALAVGGLHPAFNPPPNFPKLERIAINLSAGDSPRLRCEAYFALTSNTVQFGARAELYAAALGFSIQGEIGFDVLIQPDPFHFLADFLAQVQLKRGSTNLFKVRVEGALEGPRPLHIKGKATFEILWWDYSIRIDRTLIEGELPPRPEPVDVLPRLKEALGSPGNWMSQLPAGQRPMVTLRGKPGAATDVLLHPLGTLTVKQSVVPLNMDISRFGQAAPAGARRFTISSVSLGGQSPATEPVRDFFAPAQFFEMSDDEKLSRPSFEPMAAGVRIGSDKFVIPDDWLEVKAIEFETWIVDKEKNVARRSTPENPKDPKDPKNLYTLNPVRLLQQARFGAAGNSDLRRTGRAKYRTTMGKHRIDKEGWSIVATDDLTVQPVPGIEAHKPTSYSEAAQALRKLKQQNPAKAAGLKILRLVSEVRESIE
jgi:hypothetical protein